MCGIIFAAETTKNDNDENDSDTYLRILAVRGQCVRRILLKRNGGNGAGF